MAGKEGGFDSHTNSFLILTFLEKLSIIYIESRKEKKLWATIGIALIARFSVKSWNMMSEFGRVWLMALILKIRNLKGFRGSNPLTRAIKEFEFFRKF